MKKGYIRLIIFSILLILILLFNSFIINFFSSYILILFLILLLPVFDWLFVLEKDNHRYLNDVLFEVLVYTISFFLLYYVLGFIVGFAKNLNYLSFYGIRVFILPIIFYCIVREFFRYNMLCKAEGSKLATIVVVILFILLDMTNSIYYASLKSNYEVLRFVALTILPTISKNISYSYISRKVGYKPVILFDLIISLYSYVLPVIPNPNEYLISIIYLLLPILFAYRILKFFNRKEDHYLPSDYVKIRLKGIVIPAIIIISLVYLYSGYFKFYAIAIASGSMEPKIKVGDVVIVDRYFKKNSLEKGKIIAFKKDNIIMVHRIVKKVKLDNSFVYYTKGDANNNIDSGYVVSKDIIGTTMFKIKYIGFPTLWLRDIFN